MLPETTSLPNERHTTVGKPTTDRTTIGLVFAKEPPRTELGGAVLANGALHIPAGDPNARVDAEMTIHRDVTLWSILPHTHVRGKRWIYAAIYPDGRTNTLLSVPNYDFDWPDRLHLQTAGHAAERHEDPRNGVVRQLDGEQVESGSD